MLAPTDAAERPRAKKADSISRAFLQEQVEALREFSAVPDQRYAYDQVLNLLRGRRQVRD